MSAQNFCVFTVCNIAYLPKALVLADSLRKHHDQILHVVVFDRKRSFAHPAENIEITWVEDLGLQDWKKLAFLYDIIEFSTSLKPFIAIRLLEKYQKVIFLDPDTAIFSSLDPILRDLDEAPVVLTPHHIKPQPSTDNESDLNMMRFGSFNLGFFAVRCDEMAHEFLQWWNRRCLDLSYMESQFGLSTDQKWVTIAPCLFDFLKISFNPGYNAAAWNTFERKISARIGDGYLVNDKYQLTFFHFSNFNHSDPQYLLKRASNEAGVKYELLEEIGRQYSVRLKFYEDTVERVPYSFDYMSDGSYISPTARRAYACVKHRLQPDHDPFDAAGVVGEFVRKNHLIVAGKQSKYVYPSLAEAQRHKHIFGAVYLVMRIILRIIGPNRFYDLSKLMIYLSILRKNEGYWKL